MGVKREVSAASSQRHSALQLADGSWWDWDVITWDGGQFRLAAGYDLSYSHGLELIFIEPLFVTCPSTFRDPVFREPTPDETSLVTRQVGEASPAVLVAFEADAGGQEAVSCLIAAEQLDIVHGTVFRYWREDLAPGERLAPWVRTPHA